MFIRKGLALSLVFWFGKRARWHGPASVFTFSRMEESVVGGLERRCTWYCWSSGIWALLPVGIYTVMANT
jgi:hypothetical protein